VVTRDGYWLGRSWLRVRGAREAEGGVLERGREMQSLRERLEELEERRQRLAEQLEQAQDAVAEAEERRDEVQEQLSELGRRHASVQAQLEGKRNRLQDLAERRERLAEEAEDLVHQRQRAVEEVHEARGRLQEALERSEALEEARERLLEEKQELQERLNSARDRLREQRERRHELQLKVESATSASRSLRESVERMSAQRERLAQRRDELQAALSALENPEEGLAEKRETLLAQRLEVEEQLSEARARLSEREHRLRELERERVEADRKVQELRLDLEGRRLKAQELKVRAQGEDERLRELELVYAEVLTALPDNASEAEWQRELERIEQRVQRLGPINLAAIDEYQQLEERKGYLDSQNADLMEALETLEGAIRRIDRETRQRFKDTYDKVNAGVQRIFPRLFGGGRGYLELTGEDLLETGVAIMAQPPGKRITNIHLMSGGEKALTAVALVFAIFELNPSPFCMLDEVDAPLDEANVGRFGEMLVEMSPRVQFIFITHNKATMQIAQHLMGVTMHEPGVSRLVDVDVNEAVQLATA
jgi:chromosome segregation protein